MSGFLIDANLLYYFKLWDSDEFIHVMDLNDRWSDEEIWNYALENDLTIVTKDADFSHRIITTSPPPSIIHLRVGNMRIQELYEFLNKNWKKFPIHQKNLNW